jgi:hypothetical protein
MFVLPDRPPAVTLAEWALRWSGVSDRVRRNPSSDDLVATGLARADVDMFLSAVQPREDLPRPTEALAGMLRFLAQRDPTMSLPVAVGWSIVGCLVHKQAWRIAGEMAAWTEARMLADGWLFVLAGLSQDEAAEIVASADPSALDGVRLLASLR